MYYIFNYRSSSCLSRAITASSNLTIYVVPLCQCAVTFACYKNKYIFHYPNNFNF